MITDEQRREVARAWAAHSERRRAGPSQDTRARALRRSGGKCARCGTRRRLTVHHRIPQSEGGSHALHNLTVLCEVCHRRAHGQQTVRGEE